MKWGIRIMPREVLLNSQGRAVESLLKQNSFQLNSCRVGRYIELDMTAESDEASQAEIKKMLDFALYNPLIETYSIERLNL